MELGRCRASARPAALGFQTDGTTGVVPCHNGEFQQPRRSVESVPLDGQTAPGLQLLGRSDDSLSFRVVGGKPRNGYVGLELPGFRYDLATDKAVTLPLDVTPPGTGAKYPGGLSAYPFFAYFAP